MIRQELKSYLDHKEVKQISESDAILQWIAWLEKQGEQKPVDSYCQENCKGFQETGKCFADGDCKAKREAETIDKFKPKFKPGDWITDGCLNCKIIEVLDECYIVDTKFGKSAITFKREYNYHLWSIQDARDGDILAGSKDEVILYLEELVIQNGMMLQTITVIMIAIGKNLLFKKNQDSGVMQMIPN